MNYEFVQGTNHFPCPLWLLYFFMPAILKIMLCFPVTFYRIHMNLCQKTRSEMDVSNSFTYVLNLKISINFIYHLSLPLPCLNASALCQDRAPLGLKCTAAFVQPTSWGRHYPHPRGSKYSSALQAFTNASCLVWFLWCGYKYLRYARSGES